MTISSMSGIANADPKNEVLTPFDLREQDVIGSQIIPIFSMGIFNPLGPTIVALNILSKPDNPSVAFLFTQLNPFEQQRKIFARGSQETEIFEFMSGLYLIGEEKILGGPPDFIALATDIDPVVNSVQKLIKTLLQETVSESDLRKSLRSIREHWGDPWNRIPRLMDAFGDAIQNPEKIDNEVKQVSEFEKKELFDPDNIAALIDKSKVETAESFNKTNKVTQDQNKNLENIGLSLSEEDALKAQIFGCWSIPLGLPYNENLLVRIKLQLNPDGTVSQSEILDHARMNKPGQGFYKVLAESALRAVKLCQPLRVPTTGYERWKELQLNFDAREMLEG